ncbi:hypothetical protein ACQJBY_055295 [Aegilops geniculata]
MPIPGAATPEPLAFGCILAARGQGAQEASCVLGGGGDVVPASVAGSSDSAVGPVSPGVRLLDQGAGLADGEFSGASCETFSSGGGDVASGCATPAVVSHNSIQSSGRSGAADSCTTFSSGDVVLPSARVGDGAPAVVSSCSVQSLRHSGPASANTIIRVGWKRRPRGPRAPDERAVVADRVPPLEAAIRGFADRGTEVVVNPVLGTIFDLLAEAYEFYNLYSWDVGFGIRYDKSRQNVNGTKCMQQIVCGCVGKPERENSSSMRSNCAAMIRLQQEREQANHHDVPGCDAYVLHGPADTEHHVGPSSGSLDEKVDANAGDEERVLVLPQSEVAPPSVLC